MNRAEIIEDLHQIREKHHQEEKDLTVQERIVRRRKEVIDAIRKHGIQLKKYKIQN